MKPSVGSKLNIDGTQHWMAPCHCKHGLVRCAHCISYVHPCFSSLRRSITWSSLPQIRIALEAVLSNSTRRSLQGGWELIRANFDPKVGGGRSFARLQYCFVNNLAMVQLYPKMQSYNMCYHIMLCTYMFGAWGKDIVLLWAIIGRKVPPNHSPKHCFRKWLKALTTSSRVSRHLCIYLAHSPHQTSTSVCTFRSRFTYSVKQHPFCITLVC